MGESRKTFVWRSVMTFIVVAMVGMGYVVASPDVVEDGEDKRLEPLPTSSAADSTADSTAEASDISGPLKNFSEERVGPKAEELPELIEGTVERTPRHRYRYDYRRGKRSPTGGEGRRRRRGRGREVREDGEGGRHSDFPNVVEGIDSSSFSSSSSSSSSLLSSMRGQRRNCTSKFCQRREEAKQMRLEMIKVQILHKLRLTHVPNITKMDVPRLPTPITNLIDEYDADGRHHAGAGDGSFGDQYVEDDDEEEDDDFHATTTKVIKFGEKPPPEKMAALSNDASNTVYFEFQPQSLRAKVLRAQLYFYVKKPPSTASGSTLLLVYKMPQDSESNSKEELVCSKAVELRTARRWNHWQSCDVKQTVEDWLRTGQRNFSLKVLLNDHRARPLAVLHPNQSNDDRKPFIEVKTKPQGGSRKKRMIGINCDEERSEEKRCCRYKLTVDFDSFGWDWILAPKRYEAYYCAGECPFVFLQRYTHSHIIQQANPYGVGGPCCTPTRMSSVQLLYYDDKREIITGILPDMAVDRCGCS